MFRSEDELLDEEPLDDELLEDEDFEDDPLDEELKGPSGLSKANTTSLK